MSADIGWSGLAASLVLIVVATALSRWQGLGLAPSMAWAACRATAPLLVVGAALGLIIDPERPLFLSWLWVALMVVVAATTVRHRAREVPGLLGLSLAAMVAATAVSLTVIFGLGLFPLRGQVLVPMAGLVVGNSLGATVVAARRIVAELTDKRAEVEARLALGQPGQQAARPYVRAALRTALVPQIESTKVVGLVALPGAMTGLILAGVDPVEAVRVQAAVMFLVLGSVATTVTVVGLGLTRRLFTPDHRLVPLVRRADL
ncbi:iron export ABC transporter permease subunit FetB [soil metagenome]